MALPGYCKQALTDLPTSNINAGTNYFIISEERWYYYDGTQWIKHSENLTTNQINELLATQTNLTALETTVNNNQSSNNTQFNNVNNSINNFVGSVNNTLNNFNNQLIDLQNNSGGGTITNDYTELLLKFNGADNSTDFFDESKNNSLIISVGTPIIKTDDFKFGGSSLYLNGSSYLNVSPIIFKGDWTLECWIKTNSTGLATIMSQDPGGFPVNRAWTFLINEAGQNIPIGYYNYTVGGTSNLLNSSTNVIDNQWHHIAVVRNKTSAYLYVDGLLKSTYSNWLSHNISEFTPIYIGAHNSLGRFFIGYIDNLRISSKAIYTPTLYPEGFIVPDENFIVSSPSSPT
jgi:hypothetical protein